MKNILFSFAFLSLLMVTVPSGLGADEAVDEAAIADAAADAAGAAANGFSARTSLELQVSSRPEAKLRLVETLKIPMLAGSGALVKGNNLKTAFAAELSPVSVNGKADFTLTPIAFLEVQAGGVIGSGWTIPLGTGLGINTPTGTETPGVVRKRSYVGGPFQGFVWNAYAGGAFQFDLGAVLPGDWTHVLFRTYHEGRYKAYTEASDNEPWVYEADMGENFNGWVYNGSFVVGYQMPRSPVLDTVAFMSEWSRTFYDHPKGNWGENRTAWIYSIIFNLRLTPNLSAMLGAQMRTLRNYGDGDPENKAGTFFEDKVIDKDIPELVEFYRALLVLTCTL
ncbi:MAG: hypothetical protein LBR16_05145 [Treponema sp.]|jgi:hypothetical protein|nr:hypothetical protein [Treponema sp.]